MNILPKYENLLYAIANCGLMTEYLALKHYTCHLQDLNYLISQDILKKSGVFLLFGKATTIYVLSSIGKSLFNDYNKVLYKSDSSQLEHDYLLLKVYSSLPNDTKTTWQSEPELKSIYKTTCCDGLFIFNGKIIGVEIITNNYTKLAINERFNFINKFCDDFISINPSEIKI